MDKLVYPNTITEKEFKSLDYGGWAIGGRIWAENIQGGHIVQGATDRSGMLTSVCRSPCGGVIWGAPLDLAWENNPPPIEPQLYRVSFSKLACYIGLPVRFCRVRAKKCTYLQIHYVSLHVQETVVMMEESNLPQRRCLVWNIIVLWELLNHCHSNTALCTRGEERRIRKLAEEEYQSG